MHEAWIIGDCFIHENYHACQEAHSEERKAKSGLYLFDYYTVRCFTARPLSEEKNVVTRIMNAFLKALNDFLRMPKIVIMVPEFDLLRFISFYEQGTSEVMESILTWMVTNIQRAVQSRKDMLLHKNKGSVAPGQPNFVWVKVIDNFKSDKAALALRHKFNRALEKVIADKKSHFIMDVSEVVRDINLYNKNGLNGDGRVQYWMAIDRRLKLFDVDPTNFKPEKDNYEQRFRLPCPPASTGRRNDRELQERSHRSQNRPLDHH